MGGALARHTVAKMVCVRLRAAPALHVRSLLHECRPGLLVHAAGAPRWRRLLQHRRRARQARGANHGPRLTG